MEHYSGPLLLIISACGTEDQKITEYFTEYAKSDPRFRPAKYVVTTVGNDAGDVYWQDAVVAWAIFYPYGQESHLRFRGREVYPTEGSCRLALIVFQQAAQALPASQLFLFSTDCLSRQRE